MISREIDEPIILSSKSNKMGFYFSLILSITACSTKKDDLSATVDTTLKDSAINISGS